MKTPLEPDKWANNYTIYLYNYTIVRVFKGADAEDLVQETFYAAYKARDSFKGESSEKTWLTAILKRKIIDYYRQKSNQQLSTIEEEASEKNFEDYFQGNDILKDHWNKNRTPKEWVIDNEIDYQQEEFYTVLTNCLSKLPGNWASVFTLKTIDDYPTEQICNELNISPSNLWVIIHRAKIQLRQCIEKNWFNTV